MQVTWLDPQPSREARPALFPSPFDEVGPHTLARRCGELVMEQLKTGVIAPGLSTDVLRTELGGKMFGVLAFEASDGRVGFIKAVSGQVERAWNVPGYAPPLFDAVARDAVEPPAEVVVKSLTARVDAARSEATLLELRDALRVLDETHAARRAQLKAKHAQNKAQRRMEREAGGDSNALDQLSRGDDAERRRNEATSRDERAELVARLAPLERRLAALERLRRIVSREAMRRIWDAYVLTSFDGAERASLRSLFPAGDPPSGAADCAAPRLLDAARREGWRPLALAEFWWGAPPPGGGRVEGAWYPACREKCGPVLPFLMRGLAVAPKQSWTPKPATELDLRVVHRDARFVVVDKPEGLLSVPARDERIEDNVLARVKKAFPSATPLAVHRLDLDTSGLLLVALDVEAYRLLQCQFVSRSVEKKYVAVLEGDVTKDEGLIELPLRVDLDQRPRQLVDFEHGRAALTRWKVLERSAGRTRVAFFPLTGRTHQLRVHAAHAQGLGVPIVGDRLYGTAGERLLLHAEELRFRHPFDGTDLSLRVPAPF